MVIRNAAALARTPLRRSALAVAEAGFAAIDTAAVVREQVRREGQRLCVGEHVCSLVGTNRVLLIGVGKCALDAALALEEILGPTLADGIVLGVEERDTSGLRRARYLAGTHPLPTEQNVRASREIVAMLSALQRDDLVLVVVSGGGSTLLCLPEAGASCVDEGLVLDALMRQGARIQEINTVRKHLSLARGGHLAKYAHPAQVIGLIFSDVPGNDLSTVASGPTVRDETTVADAAAVLARYGVLAACELERCGLVETPKEEEFFARVTNVLLVSNQRALAAMAERARTLGFTPTICSDCLAGEASEVGRTVARELHAAPGGAVRLYGGETTVTVRGAGQGGRNRELALAALPELGPDELALALASDGRDNGEAAGAICDRMTGERARQLGTDPALSLAANDSGTFFRLVGDEVVTGPTGANVADLLLVMKSPLA